MRARGRRLRAVALAAAVAGCSSADTRSVGVTGAAGDVRIAFGTHWITDRATSALEVPATAGVVTAFVDTNGDGRLARYAEPSADCTLAGDDWHCAFAPHTLTVHRMISRRSEVVNDKTVLFWEGPAEACLGEKCTRTDRSPFVNGTADVHLLSLCEGQGFTAGVARAAGTTLPVEHPPEIALTATAEARANGELRVALAGTRPAKLLVWAGRFYPSTTEPYEVLWTSEDAPVRIAGDIVIPREQAAACAAHADCEIVLQAATSWPGTARSLTELRQVVWSR